MGASDGERGGFLAANVLTFCRTLRHAGMPVGTGQVLDALKAAAMVGVERRDDLYYALKSVLVNEPAHFALFGQAFHVYFRNQQLLRRTAALAVPDEEADGRRADPGALRRLLEALDPAAGDQRSGSSGGADRSLTWSREERLKRKDFAQMSLAEQRAARELLDREIELFRPVKVRRFRAAATGNRYDLRRTMQLMTRSSGQLIQLARKRRRESPPVIVLLCDISGSMSAYSRIFLHFAHALQAVNPRVRSFVFGTRLTNISHRLEDSDVDRALALVASDVRDWDGGTRIADSLQRFNVDWGRRVLAQNAVVVLLTDGLERGSDADLAFQTARLRRSCRRLVWLNPVLRYDEFEPRATGIRAMLPQVDYFLPAHNVDGLATLCAVLRGEPSLSRGGPAWRFQHLAGRALTPRLSPQEPRQKERYAG